MNKTNFLFQMSHIWCLGDFRMWSTMGYWGCSSTSI